MADEIHAKIQLTARCNNACVFCYNRHSLELRRTLDEATALRCIDECVARGCHHLNLIGGEVTTLPFFLRLLEHAGGRFSEISINTNGRAFANMGLADAATAAGLNFVDVSLHASSAPVHDSLTRMPGSFAETTQGLENLVALRRAGRRVELSVTTLLLEGTLEDLDHLAGTLRRIGVMSWRLKFPHEALGVSETVAANGYIPCLDSVLPFVLAVVRNHGKHLSIRTHDVPLCLLEDLAGHSSDLLDTHWVRVMDGETTQTVRTTGRWGHPAAVCHECSAANVCCGISPAYYQSFGDAALRPLKEDQLESLVTLTPSAPAVPVVRRGTTITLVSSSGVSMANSSLRQESVVQRLAAIAVRLERRGSNQRAEQVRSLIRSKKSR